MARAVMSMTERTEKAVKREA